MSDLDNKLRSNIIPFSAEFDFLDIEISRDASYNSKSGINKILNIGGTILGCDFEFIGRYSSSSFDLFNAYWPNHLTFKSELITDEIHTKYAYSYSTKDYMRYSHILKHHNDVNKFHTKGVPADSFYLNFDRLFLDFISTKILSDSTKKLKHLSDYFDFELKSDLKLPKF